MGPSFIFTILITSIMFGAPSFTGDQEDVSRRISAAKGYADVSLSRSNYKYDGGCLVVVSGGLVTPLHYAI